MALRDEPMPEIEKYEILVLGSGEVGKYLAWTMAKEGRATALIERERVGLGFSSRQVESRKG
jgi:glycerol-3-phosphate dehydrogenase